MNSQSIVEWKEAIRVLWGFVIISRCNDCLRFVVFWWIPGLGLNCFHFVCWSLIFWPCDLNQNSEQVFNLAWMRSGIMVHWPCTAASRPNQVSASVYLAGENNLTLVCYNAFKFQLCTKEPPKRCNPELNSEMYFLYKKKIRAVMVFSRYGLVLTMNWTGIT